MAAYLVTGGAGFLGSWVVEALVEAGHRVRVLDDLSTGKRQNLEQVEGGIELIVGDIRGLALVSEAITGIEYIIHLAAIPSVTQSIHDPLSTNEVNVQGTLNLLQAAREARVKRLVFASSSSIYGNQPQLPQHEDMSPRPLSPYSLQKLTAETYCSLFYRLYGLETVSLRFFNIYGPRQDPGSVYSGVISRFTTALLENDPPVIYGDGHQSRDFTFVADAARASLLAALKPEAAGQNINVASDSPCAVIELLTTLKELAGSDLSPAYEAPRPGEIRHSQGDGERARKLLGYEPEISLPDGLRQTLNWFKANYRKVK